MAEEEKSEQIDKEYINDMKDCVDIIKNRIKEVPDSIIEDAIGQISDICDML